MSQVAVWRGAKAGVLGYWHHGVLCPDGTVIHYTRGTHRTKRNARIRRTSLARFCKGAPDVFDVRPADDALLLPVRDAVRRAESRLGEDCYNILFNNCETFAKWCVTGEDKSRQINSHFKYVLRGMFPFGLPGAIFGLCVSAVKMSIGDQETQRLIKRA